MFWSKNSAVGGEKTDQWVGVQGSLEAVLCSLNKANDKNDCLSFE